MSSVLKGWLYMMGAMFALLGVVLIDRLAYLATAGDEALHGNGRRGVMLSGDTENIWLVMACGMLVYAAGISVLRRPDEHLPEGPVPIALGVLSIGPMVLFGFAVWMLRG
ncbi:MAG: hypothetical protein ABWZ54_03320 [Luteibacter sp.]